MKKYSVAPNKDVTGWFVKIEDIAPEKEYGVKDDAIAEGERVAKVNSPSKLIILDKNHEVLEERTY